MEKVIANLQPTGYDSHIENTVGDYTVTGSIRASREKTLTSMEGTISNSDGEYAGRFSISGGPAVVGPEGGSPRRLINLNDVPVDFRDSVYEAVNVTLAKVQAELANPDE